MYSNIGSSDTSNEPLTSLLGVGESDCLWHIDSRLTVTLTQPQAREELLEAFLGWPKPTFQTVQLDLTISNFEVSMCPARRTVNRKSICPASVNHVGYRVKLGVHTRDCTCLRPDWTVASQSGRDSSASIAPTKPRTLSRPDPDLATHSRQLMCMHHGAIWCLDTHQ